MKKLLHKKIYQLLLFFLISNFSYSQLSGVATHIPNATCNLNSNEWSYITIIKGANNQGQIYKNGSLIYTGSWLNLTYNWSRVDLGAVYYTSFSQFFNGQIDELRISNTVRTSAEILSHYNNNVPFTSDSNTLGLWHFDDTNSAVLSSTIGQNGVGTNTSVTTGKFGNSILFNGSTSRVSINQSVPTQNITIEFWIKPIGSSNSWPVSLYGYNTTGFAINTVCATPSPTGLAQQTFCSAATITNLVATGTSIKWYATPSGDTTLSGSEPLVDGTTYYASQTVNGCQSTSRFAVTVNINYPEIQASATTICKGNSVSLEALPGTSIISNFEIGSVGPAGGYVFYDQGSVINGWRYLEVAPIDVNSSNNFNLGCYCTTISNASNNIGSGLTNTTAWANSGCPTIASTFSYGGFLNWFIPSKDELNMIYINLKLNNIGNFSNIQYWSSSPASYGSCGINGGAWVQNFSNGTQLGDYRPGYQGSGNVRLVRQFSSGIPNSTYLWSTGATTSSISPAPTQTTDYWVDVTTNGVTCRKSITITVNNTPAPTGATTQVFCGAKTISNLAVTGTAVKWYTTATGGTSLVTTTALTTGTYYASQTINGCESQSRLAVTVTVNTTLPPTGVAQQTLCEASTIANLTATGTSIKWYVATTTVGTALASSTALANGNTYYASQTVNGCESVSRLAVTVNINSPQIQSSATSICIGSSVSLTAFDRNNVQQSSDSNNLPSNLQNGLVGYWPFNGNANDESGNGNNGIINGATLGDDRFGNFGKAYFFSNGNQNIILPPQQNNPFTTTMTYSLWYYEGTNSDYVNIFNASGKALVLNPNSNGIRANDGNTFGVDAYSPLLQTNIWKNIIVVYQDQTISIYINGNLISSRTTGFNAIIQYLNTQSVIGSTYLMGGQYPFRGLVDDVAIFNRVLTSSEIQQLYNLGQTSFLWSTGATTSSISPAPTQTTDYWVDVTTNGVTCRKSITITVNNTPAPTGATTQVFCGAKTISNLAVTGTAVKWYTTATGGTSLVTTTALTSGTYYASQTINGCESQSRLAVNAVINSLPNATLITSGGTILKLNDLLTLSTVTNVSGQTYKWIKNNAIIATTLTNSYKVNTSGNYKVEVINSNGCAATSNSIDVLVVPQTNFTIASIGETCVNMKNGSITIVSKIPLNYIATLFNNGVVVQTNNFSNQTYFKNLNGGNYTLCISIASDQEVYQQCYDVKVNKPQELSVFSSLNDSNILNLSLSGGNSYEINLNGKTVTTQSSQIALSTQSGKNNLIVTTDMNCQGVYSETFIINDAILTHPNPFSDEFTIQLPNSILLDLKETISVKVFNLNGVLIYQAQENKGLGYIKLSLGSIAVGTYLLHVENNIFKIVKK